MKFNDLPEDEKKAAYSEYARIAAGLGLFIMSYESYCKISSFQFNGQDLLSQVE